LKKTLFILLKAIGILLLLLAISIWAFLNFHPTFGDVANSESLSKFQLSENYDGEVFKNLIPTNIDTRDPQTSESMVTSIFKMISPEPGKIPNTVLPSIKFKKRDLTNNSFAWLGHSTIVMNVDNLVIITDPVLYNASPVPGTVAPFAIEHTITANDLPDKIDVVLISHDHYDHLDYQAIQELEPRINFFYVPLGIKAHLLKWGVPNTKIKEKDWEDTITHKQVTFTMTPARHFSGRGLNNRFSTLWCSWVIESNDLSIFFNGDSGYFEEYKKIGKEHGPFDISFMENGAYDKNWAEIHMLPEQSVQASIDLNSNLMFPIHWGKFDLANHTWKDPIIRASNETEVKNVNIATPLIGEIFTLNNIPHKKWWQSLN
jgi:L-ascorbate metabolism protein UlaG (beta-lactamase superfamily)